jgi:hypothetical protein
MAGGPEVSLREHLENRLACERELSDAHWGGHAHEHAQVALALLKSEQTLNARLDAMNEFRSQLTGQAQTFATKEMLIPYQSFMDRFNGTLTAFTIINAVLTLVISLLLWKWH